MTMGSFGLRSSGSYGSLQQIQNTALCLPIQTTPPLSRKPPKMLKEKDRFFHWIFKFAPRKKIGMLLLCFVSLIVFTWVLFVGKGEEARESIIPSINLLVTGEEARESIIPSIHIISTPTSEEKVNASGSSQSQTLEVLGSVLRIANATLLPPPPPPVYFTGYKLPPGNPCEHFTLPPPPADKKRTGPRPCPVCYLPLEDAVALIPC